MSEGDFYIELKQKKPNNKRVFVKKIKIKTRLWFGFLCFTLILKMPNVHFKNHNKNIVDVYNFFNVFIFC